MKVYIGIIAILAFVFFQVNKNYENNPEFARIKYLQKDSLNWLESKQEKYSIYYRNTDAKIQKEIIRNIENGIHVTELFFDQSFIEKFSVNIFPNREELDKQWQTDWNMPKFKSKCWMVASGTASRLDLLSPQLWKDEACEHSFENKTELKRLICHELVHVYHGQNNPIPDFEGMDDIGWFLEGLAVYVSGQLDEERIARAKKAFEKNKIPDELEKIWSGRYRYATAGSLVAFIDKKYGRKRTIELIKCTTETEILNVLNCTEADLLHNWKKSISL